MMEREKERVSERDEILINNIQLLTKQHFVECSDEEEEEEEAFTSLFQMDSSLLPHLLQATIQQGKMRKFRPHYCNYTASECLTEV